MERVIVSTTPRVLVVVPLGSVATPFLSVVTVKYLDFHGFFAKKFRSFIPSLFFLQQVLQLNKKNINI
jgi:hypothetical protein